MMAVVIAECYAFGERLFANVVEAPSIAALTNAEARFLNHFSRLPQKLSKAANA